MSMANSYKYPTQVGARDIDGKAIKTVFTEKQTVGRTSGVTMLSGFFKQQTAQKEKEQEDLFSMREDIQNSPEKYVKAILSKLPPKAQDGQLFSQSIQYLDNDHQIAKLHGAELLKTLKELKDEASRVYQQKVGIAFYNQEAKMISNEALKQYKLLGKLIKQLENAM
jgi:hypothetical protein